MSYLPSASDVETRPSQRSDQTPTATPGKGDPFACLTKPVTAVKPSHRAEPPTIRPTKGGAGVFVGRGVGRVVGLAVGRRVGLAVAVGVLEGGGVGVMVGLRVAVGVSVGIGVSVAIGVLVGVLDGVGVGEGVRVCVAVTVAVKVGLGVRVGVADGPACRSGRNCDREQASETQVSRMTTAMMATRFFISSPVGMIRPGFGHARRNLPHYNRDMGFLQEMPDHQCATVGARWCHAPEFSVGRIRLTVPTRYGTMILSLKEGDGGATPSPDVRTDGH
jgi:hypothetical protein